MLQGKELKHLKKKKIVGQLGPVRSAIQNNGTDEEIVIILVTMPASF